MNEKVLEKRIHNNQATFFAIANRFDNFFVENAGFYDATIEDIKKIKKESLRYINLLEAILPILKKRHEQLN